MDHTSKNQQDEPRRRWEWLLLLLVLPISFGCVFCSAQLALSSWPEWLNPASLLPQRQADYSGGPRGLYFAAIDSGVAAQAATDIARLQLTPTGDGDGSPSIITLLPATPTMTPTLDSDSQPPQPDTATPFHTAVPSDTPTVRAPTPSPVPTVTPVPTLVPTPTIVPPTNTPIPTSTLIPTATLEPTPTPTFTPSNDDDDGGSSPANIPPIVANDIATTAEDNGITIAVLINDSDMDGVLVLGSLSLSSGPSNGTASVNPTTGDAIYTPNQDFNGLDSFAYQVCDNGGACSAATVDVVVTPVNDPPVAMDDISFSAEDTIENIFVRDNDIDIDDLTLTITAVGPAANGAAITDGSTVIYTPTMDFNGTDVLTYTVSDGSLTSSATVTVTVYATNDPPLAVADSYTTTTGLTLTVSSASGVLSNDTDIDVGDSLNAVKVTDPISGSLTLNSDGSLTYVPNIGFVGIDSFSYRAHDTIMSPSNVVTVTITVL